MVVDGGGSLECFVDEATLIQAAESHGLVAVSEYVGNLKGYVQQQSTPLFHHFQIKYKDDAKDWECVSGLYATFAFQKTTN
jgi:hypothetical protein